MGQGSAAPPARLQVTPPRLATAPVQSGTRPQATREPQDELSAKLRALAQMGSTNTALPQPDNGGSGGGGGGDGNYALTRLYPRADFAALVARYGYSRRTRPAGGGAGAIVAKAA